MVINQTKIKVRYVETDQMGIVHHSNYYAWFEVGRTEFFEEINDVIRESDGKLLAQGRTVHTFVTHDFKLVNLKKKRPDVWKKLLSLVDDYDINSK